MVDRPVDPSAGKNPQRGSARATGASRKPSPKGKPKKPGPNANRAQVRVAVVEAEPVDVETDETVAEAELGVEAELEPQVEVEPELEPEPGPELEAEAELEPEPDAEPVASPIPFKQRLEVALAWVKRALAALATFTVAFSKRAAAMIRQGAVAVSTRFSAMSAVVGDRVATARTAARERAASARQAAAERSETRALARIEDVSAEPVIVDTDLSFELTPVADDSEFILAVDGLSKSFDGKIAVSGVKLRVPPGSFYGIVGPNGAGKTTTLSMITGLLRPDAGTVTVHGADVWSNPAAAKRNMGVLPDRLRLFDRLTGAQLLFYAGVLRGLDAQTVRRRSADLAAAFGLEEALARLVSDYSAGMTKKIALAAALIHSPRLLVLDEPFESVDPVSAANVTNILKQYAAAGGTVVLSSHSMDLVQRICDHVAVVVGGVILADGTMDEVRNGRSLEDRFIELAGARTRVEGLEWLHSFSD